MPNDQNKPHHSLPEIKVDVKVPPSSGGIMNWGPLFGWVKSLFKSRKK
jgi:hypothetical protein